MSGFPPGEPAAHTGSRRKPVWLPHAALSRISPTNRRGQASRSGTPEASGCHACPSNLSVRSPVLVPNSSAMSRWSDVRLCTASTSARMATLYVWLFCESHTTKRSGSRLHCDAKPRRHPARSPDRGSMVVTTNIGLSSPSRNGSSSARWFGPMWVSAVVRELERDVEVGRLEHRDDGLQVVTRLAGHAHLVARDLRLDALGALVADDLGDLLGVLAAQALLERGAQAVLLARRLGLVVARVERLERDPAPDELALEDVEDREHALGRVRHHEDSVAAPRDRRTDVLEVVALRDLLGGLVQRVVDLLAVDLADDVERRVGHGRLLRGGFRSWAPP